MTRANATFAILAALCFALGLGACKGGKETETPVAVKPTRPPSPSGTMSLRGNYEYRGSVGTFEDCTTGQRWRVAQEGDNVALEEAYIVSGVPIGEPLVVSVEGGIDRRPSPDRDGDETMLIIARFVTSWPGADCLQPSDLPAPSP
ncbi:MAG: hypothetical protein AAF500_03505 [Myxococcota bacterium]